MAVIPSCKIRLSGWLAAAILVCSGCQARPEPLPGFPRLVLWAWERNENLQFIDPRSTGVAFLARTVQWREGQVTSRPRLQPLQLPVGTAVMAVVRLESAGTALPEAAAVSREILKSAALQNIRGLQIDFDARLSEREWYGQLIRTVRAGMKPEMRLTITALASWCDRDGWFGDIPIDDAVPMLFRMGTGEPTGVREFRVSRCRSSFGVSTDELPDGLPSGRRLYVFDPRPWDEETYRGILRLAAKWS